MESHAVPPPPSFHHSPVQVFAAISITLSDAAPSGPFEGSPGTSQNFQRNSPVSASQALTKPRTPRSAPPLPTTTRPSNTRGAPVIDQGAESSKVRTSHTGVPFFAFRPIRRPSSVAITTLSFQKARP